MWYCCCYPGNSHGSSWLKNLRPHNRRRHSHNDCEWSAYKAHTSHSGGQPLSVNVPHFHFALAFAHFHLQNSRIHISWQSFIGHLIAYTVATPDRALYYCLVWMLA